MILRLLSAAAALVALSAVGCSDVPSPVSADPAETRQVTADAGPSRMPLVGIRWDAKTTWAMQLGALVRVDRRSLRPLPGPRIELGIHGYSWSYSPDRSRIVLGGFASGLRFVDLERFEPLGDLREKRRGGLVLAVAWPAPRRVLALVQEPWGGGQLTLVIVDPIGRRVLERRSVSGRASVVSAVANRLGLFALLAPPRGIGPSTLLVVDAGGKARTLRLGRLRAGQRSGRPSASGRVDRRWAPGLTLDLAGRRAFVVGGAAPVAEIDLRSMRVAYHELREPISLLGRLRNWLEPAAQAKGETEGPVRYADWLGNGRLAVSGFDARGVKPSQAKGLKLIDTRTWAVRTLDQKAGDFVWTRGLLLAYGCCYRTGDQSLGLTAYDPSGRLLWQLFGQQPIHAVQVSGARAYVRLEGPWRPQGPSVAVVDLGRGRVRRTMQTAWIQLLLPHQSSMAEKEG